MKEELTKCVLAFDQGLRDCTRAEDRVLAEKYLACLAPIFAMAMQGHDIAERIQTMDKLLGTTWVQDTKPFQPAFDAWEKIKAEHQNRQR